MHGKQLRKSSVSGDLNRGKSPRRWFTSLLHTHTAWNWLAPGERLLMMPEEDGDKEQVGCRCRRAY